MIDLIGYVAGILGTICWLPQVLKAWRTQETRDLSLSTSLMIFATMTLWLIYGLALMSWPLILANALSLSMISAIILAKLRFG
ncbi:SemiSWEET family sugar transporter [Paracoccaceae bacterium GXU_MW_L88]